MTQELKHPQYRALTSERRRELVDKLVAADHDRAALLIELLSGVIDEGGDQQRAEMARSAMEQAFRQTGDFQNAFVSYLDNIP